MSLYLAGVMVVWHITNQRHIITLLPLIAFLFGYAFHQVIRNKIATAVLTVLLLIFASFQAYRMPNFRQHFNAPKEFLDLTAIIKNDTHVNGKTLVIYAFDTVMYTRKPVIWPYPDLRTIPTDLFQKQAPDKLHGLFKHYHIDFIVIDMGYVPKIDDFNGRNYPLPFIDNIDVLLQQGKISLLNLTKSKRLLLLRVI